VPSKSLQKLERKIKLIRICSGSKKTKKKCTEIIKEKIFLSARPYNFFDRVQHAQFFFQMLSHHVTPYYFFLCEAEGNNLNLKRKTKQHRLSLTSSNY
jgi:hypothetical protein